MEAKLLKDPDNKCDYVYVSADEQSLSYLNSGNPLRVAFFTDNNENLPFYKRKAMVVIIGKDLDFKKHKTYKAGFFRKGLVDKSYLIDYIQKMKKKLIQMAMQELDVLDIPEEPMTAKLMIENMQEPQEEIMEKSGETIDRAQAAEILNVSPMTISNLAKKGLIKGQHNGFGWSFVKSDIENIIKEKPDFLREIWNHSKSITKREPYSKEIIEGNETFIHIRKAEKIINLSRGTITLYAKRGLIRHKKEHRKDYYISLKHMGELKANPPDWLKKSWRYFNNSKAE
jgi:hypothetical protein